MNSIDQQTAKTPVHVIAGFLGVGKTTAILDLLAKLSPQESNAVLVNEWGNVSLDSAVIASQGSSASITDISGGCICCTAGAAFDNALDMVMNEVNPNRIFIEPSGVAKPGEIIDLLRCHKQAERFDLRPVIGLVDPERFLQPQILRMPLYRDQVESSQILVANRCDTVDEEKVRAFYEKASELYPPKTTVLTTSHGRLPLEVLDVVITSVSNGAPSRPQHDSHKHDDTTEHEFTQAGWIWPPATRFSEKALNEFFEELALQCDASPPKLVRAKGIFHTDHGWFLMELAGKEFHRRGIQYRYDSRCQFIASRGTSDELGIFKNRLEQCIIHKS